MESLNKYKNKGSRHDGGKIKRLDMKSCDVRFHLPWKGVLGHPEFRGWSFMSHNSSPPFRRQRFSRSIQEWVTREELFPSCPETNSSSSELFVLDKSQIHIHRTEGSGKQSMFKSALCQAEMLHKVEENVLLSQRSPKCQILTAFQRQDTGLDGPIVWLRLTDFLFHPLRLLVVLFWSVRYEAILNWKG